MNIPNGVSSSSFMTLQIFLFICSLYFVIFVFVFCFLLGLAYPCREPLARLHSPLFSLTFIFRFSASMLKHIIDIYAHTIGNDYGN